MDLPQADGLLRHGVYSKPNGRGVDECTIWGDHYLCGGPVPPALRRQYLLELMGAERPAEKDKPLRAPVTFDPPGSIKFV